jgi:predicted ATPase
VTTLGRENSISIAVENWGPILSGNVDLKPLTIFIGPNNTGKSYLAMLFYALISGLRGIFSVELKKSFIKKIVNQVMKELDKEKNKFEEIRHARTDKIFSEITARLCYIVINNYKELITIDRSKIIELLKRIYSSELDDLINFYSKKAGFKLETPDIQLIYQNKEGKLYIDYEIKDKERILKQLRKLFIHYFSFTFRRHLLRFYRRKNSTQKRKFLTEMVSELLIDMSTIFERLLSPQFNIYYLPAARSGILQGYRGIAASIVAVAPLIPLRKEELRIPQLSGPVADFISMLIYVEPSRGRRLPILPRREVFKERKGINNTLKFLREEVLKGDIEVIRGEKLVIPEIFYKVEKSIPIARTSSMVSETAPIYLFVRYWTGKNDFLVIEEPESHLHPSAQRLIARVLSKLVRAGVNIIISTHSDFLLNEISHIVMLNYQSEKDRLKLGYDYDDYLRPEEVAVYLFKSENKGSIIEPLEVTKEGIPDDEFRKVAEIMHEESWSLRVK